MAFNLFFGLCIAALVFMIVVLVRFFQHGQEPQVTVPVVSRIIDKPVWVDQIPAAKVVVFRPGAV